MELFTSECEIKTTAMESTPATYAMLEDETIQFISSGK